MESSEITRQLLEAKGNVIFMGYQSQNEMEELKRIELASRTCYKSENNITETSAIKMFNMLYNKKHYAMLRFGERTIAILESDYLHILNILLDCRYAQYFRDVVISKNENSDIKDNTVLVTANLQSWIMLFKAAVQVHLLYKDNILNNTIITIVLQAFEGWPEMTKLLKNILEEENIFPHWMNENKYVRDVDKEDIPFGLRRFCFRIVTDRGITHEIVRHTTLSYVQESTRYVKYNGQEAIMFIPEYLKNNKEALDIFYENFNLSLMDYEKLLEEVDIRPSEARNVLPHSLKAEICISGYYDKSEYGEEFNQGFSHFIDMRNAKDAHKGIQQIAREIKKHLVSYVYNDTKL